MPVRRFTNIAMLLGLLFAASAATTAAAPSGSGDTDDSGMDPATRSAVYLLQQSITVRSDGTHHRLLRSLRHLADPTLEPLFAALAAARHPALKIHGILGLAEISETGQLDLRRVVEVDDAAVQAELITAAMDSDLLSDDDAERLVDWPGLDEGVRLLAATRLIEAGRSVDLDMLREGLEANRLARRGMAALLLHQADDPAGVRGLQKLNTSQDTDRDRVRAMLLTTAQRHKLHRSGTWAYSVAVDPAVDSRLALLALQTAMRFGDPRAAGHWRHEFESTHDMARRTRLALVALYTAPWLEAETFATLEQADDSVLVQMGRTGRAIAERRDVAAQVGRLIALQHPVANRWALHHAGANAQPDDARQIYRSVIAAYEHSPEAQRTRRLDEAVRATEALHDLDPAAAATLLRPMIAEANADPLLVRAVLLGLARARRGDQHAVIAGIADWPDQDARWLALLLGARAGEAMDDRQSRDLAMLVQGAGGIQDTLRIQAAWQWLKRNDQTQPALARVLRNM